MVRADDIDDHRAALNQIPAARLRMLEEKADAPGLVHFGLHVSVLAVLGAAILALPGPWWVLALVAYSVALIFLFAPLHETVHETAFRTVWLNRVVGALCGFILVLPALSCTRCRVWGTTYRLPWVNNSLQWWWGLPAIRMSRGCNPPPARIAV